MLSPTLTVLFVVYLGHAHEVKGVKSAIESAHHDTVTRFQREIKQLKTINQDLQQKYQTKQQDYKDKVCSLCNINLGSCLS